MILQLVKVRHGSHLYGTNTVSSDIDYKSVHLPSGESIILQRAEDVINRNVKISSSLKNQSCDIDDQSYSLQKFLSMLAAGDTVSTEILFATPEESSKEWDYIQSLRPRLINRQCKGFVGYCRRQAAKYGVKGSRLNAVKSIIDYLDTFKDKKHQDLKLSNIENELRQWSEGKDHISWENIPSPTGDVLWHLNVCDRKMPMTVKISEAYAVWEKVWQNYGDRARQAATNQGIDWKAVSHAVRVARQAIELLQTGNLQFPRPDCEELLDIKLGKLPYSRVSSLLENLVEQVEEVALSSLIQEKPDLNLHDSLVKQFYLKQINNHNS